MSRIESLSIQGIRNFAPGSPEVIQFEPPVTLILGKNGSGKTTIIESLKYATTGEMPVGTGRGQNFIHDPKLTDKKMSIGQVKLMFCDESGRQFIITRSMEAKLLKNKLDFKSTDGTLAVRQPDGNFINHKNKVNDLNTFMSSTLGVSKALLNNVLFCHQEDSNWPLDEAKKVKDKFDDIFNTTRYVKCQDEIRKQIVEVKSKMKDIEADVKQYKMRKAQVDEYREEMRLQSERKENLVEQMQKLRKNKEDLEDQLKKSHDLYKRSQELRNEMSLKQTRLENLVDARKALEMDITEVLTADTDALMKALGDFETTKAKREMELENMNRTYQGVAKEHQNVVADQQEKLVQLGRLQLEKEQHVKRIRERDLHLIDLANRYQWEGCNTVRQDESLTPVQVIRLHGLLNRAVEQAKADEAECKRQAEAEEQRLLEELNQLRASVVRMEQDIRSRESSLSASYKESSHIEAQLNAMEENSRQLTQLERQHSEAHASLREEEGKVNVEEMLREIDQTKKAKVEQEKTLDHNRAQLKKLLGQREIRLKLDMLTKELNSKRTAERRSMGRERVDEAVKILKLDPRQDNLLSSYNSAMATLAKTLAEKRQCMNALGKQSSTIEADLRNIRKNLSDKESEATDFKERLKTCGGTALGGLESDIKSLTDDLEKMEDERGQINGKEKIYANFVKKVKDQGDHASCPTCAREFEDPNEVEEMLQELQGVIDALPGKKIEYDKAIAEKKAKLDQFLLLRPIAKSAAKLVEEMIPELRIELKSLESQSAAIQSELREAEFAVESCLKEENAAKLAHSDIVQIDSFKVDIKKLVDQVAIVQAQLGSPPDDELSVDDVQKLVEAGEANCRATSNAVEALNEKYHSHQKNLFDLKQKVNALMERKLKLTDSLQQRGSLAERKEKLLEVIESLSAGIAEGRSTLQPLISQQVEAERAHANAQKRRNQLTEESRKRVEELQLQVRHSSALNDEIENWNRMGKEEHLRCRQSEVDVLGEKKLQLEQRRSKVAEDIARLESTLNNSATDERNLRNNLKLIQNAKDTQKISEELDQLTAHLAGYKVEQLVREIKHSQTELETCKDQLGQLQGSYGEITKSVEDLEKKLQREEFATAESRYLERIKDFEIHLAISEDLTSFYNALEWALMKFHKERMSVINRMVRDMWHQTYKGKDIDYVEIRAEESAVTGNTRRQYNYRVVMVKNAVEMDMRGRCSAGQKVLASLIIRMALAEAFSSKCGILALDEPTTNLDEDNIAALSDTILELSNAMSRQKRKFQLIIITHDEKFLERMSRDKRMEKFYRVDRNRFNLSEIRQFDVMGGMPTIQKKK